MQHLFGLLQPGPCQHQITAQVSEVVYLFMLPLSTIASVFSLQLQNGLDLKPVLMEHPLPYLQLVPEFFPHFRYQNYDINVGSNLQSIHEFFCDENPL